MKENKDKIIKYTKRAVGIVAAAVLGFLTVLTVYIMVCNMRGKTAEVFGVSIMKVLTGSMEPSIHEGDFIIVEKADVSSLETGDIISFYSQDKAIYGGPNTHRIVKKNEDGSFVTKGDANTEPDPTVVTADKIIGKYSGKARILKWINSFSSLKKLIFMAVIILMTAAAVYEVRTVVKLGGECKAEKEQEKEKALRDAIEKEKQKLYEEGYKPENDDKGGGC